MDYKKLHKDTIAKLQEMVNSGKITVEIARGICADFISESDDERMVKFIKNQLFNIKKTITENYELDAKLTKAIDWLEKQGEHANFRNNIQIGDKVTRNEDGVLVNLSQLKRVAKKDEKKGEQKPDEEYNITGIHSKHAEGKLGEMIKNLKSAWSEEDEIILNDIMHNIHFAETHRNVTGSSAMEKEQVNWLKSLKDRVQPQQEWSEEDEDILNTIINHFKVDIECTDEDDMVRWLKSLKERVQPNQVINYPDNLPKDNWELIHEFVNKFGRIPKDEDELNVLIEYVLKRQNHDWSKEDEEQLDRALYMMEQLDMTKSWDDVYNFLKSLKDRVQSKQEWSEDDESRRKKIIHILSLDGRIKNEELSDINNWLKSLRPQNRWKPSDEQMKQLGWIAEQNKDNMIGKELMSLYQDLLKLKE